MIDYLSILNFLDSRCMPIETHLAAPEDANQGSCFFGDIIKYPDDCPEHGYGLV